MTEIRTEMGTRSVEELTAELQSGAARIEELRQAINSALAKSPRGDESGGDVSGAATQAADAEGTTPEIAGISVVIPADMKAHLDSFAKAKRSTVSSIVRSAVADSIGYDLEAANMRSRARRGHYQSDEARKQGAKLKYQQDQALLRAARAALGTSGPAGAYIKNRLKEQGVATLS